ncbi:hypothetical protein WPS_03950 [Vulcanimicrobium alpinum]|uniref:Uncharacterized protein n=1 Tax=Vulcanimicrobium alpinum TaxID=3016050 RepID=A0AAN1XSY5_UNVUL|nr:hypothetical protein [Vulcanimicrobium alpinum]BDE05119.1 hypothetical protein WPS_03950 [Vulcanimicrobium alpinum]
MARYYLIATIIVVAFGCIVFARRVATLRDFEVRAGAGAPPSPAGAQRDGVPPPAQTFAGDGPWVLSALPSCFAQQSSLTGTALQLAFDVPPARERVAPGTRLHSGNCTLVVGAHDVTIERDGDRLRVPPDAALYDTPKGLTLFHTHAGRAELRVYNRLPVTLR